MGLEENELGVGGGTATVRVSLETERPSPGWRTTHL